MRILHVAFQDLDQPGSGGGARRTYEIDRRLGTRHHITVLTAAFPGSRPTRKYNADYIPIGVDAGYYGRMLSYLLALPLAVRALDFDLLVEDFAPPFATCFCPAFTSRPVVASVQWLFARGMAEKYGLPFQLVETPAMSLYKNFVVLTDSMRDKLSTLNPRARYAVIPNGVDRDALEIEKRDEGYVLFLGRIDIHQKGLDLLLKAFREVSVKTGATLVVAGDGPDFRRVIQMSEAAEGKGSVRFVGLVAGRRKFELLARACLTCVPSRYETFGMVALESLACGTPVIGFDIDCLREVVPPEAGTLVRPFDMQELANGIIELLENPARARAMGQAGRAFAANYDWDHIAEMQERYYLEICG